MRTMTVLGLLFVLGGGDTSVACESSGPADARQSQTNVLLIAVDDLRPELGCYGAEHILSPSIDRLAATGVLFERAYCQQAVCNPSRSSLMTGRQPDSIGITSNHAHFRTQHPDLVTLPQHFRRHGYHAAAIGKIYHGVFPDGASRTKWDTMGDPESWSVPAVRFGPRYYYTEEGIAAAKGVYQRIYKPKNPAPDDWTQKLVFGPATEAPDIPDEVLYDGQVASAAVDALRDLSKRAQPFFLAVGFIKPHSPYIAPQRYFDLYDRVTLAESTALPRGAPSLAGHGSGELRRYTDQPARDAIPESNQRRVRQAYYACVSFIDAQVGRVLDELEHLGLADDTIVVLYGDHGYHLGEQGLWGKTTNYELDTRVPLIVRVPRKRGGVRSESLVELVDLYPTLAELSGLPVSAELDGLSFAPILDNPEHVTRSFARSQYPRGGGLMGYSVRTPTHRLTQWVHRASGEIRATELYDYRDGLTETVNLATDHPGLVSELTETLTQAFAGSFVTSPAPHAAQVQQTDDADRSTSFEKAASGPFDRLDSPVGTWRRETGVALIDDKHSVTGKQCLQLAGGERTSVVLQLPDDQRGNGDLIFRAERWTRRTPFTFRVEEQNDDAWREIFNGDAEIRVGRPFLSHVRIPVDGGTKRLRFTVSSPPATGILIDDFRIVPAIPQKLVGVEVLPLTQPALVGAAVSPLQKLRVRTRGRLNPVSLTRVQATLTGTTDVTDVSELQLWRSGPDGDFAQAVRVAAAPVPRDTATPVTFECSGKTVLDDGANDFFVTCRVVDAADIDHRIGAACTQCTFSDGASMSPKGGSVPQRLGVAVRDGGDDGAHTYRIPGLATTNKGTLIGVYDVRRRGGGDLPGDIDVGMSRSTDGGRTWQRMRIIMDMGDDPAWRHDGIGDPAVLVDRTTGTIWVAATWSHGNRSWFGSGPGLKPEETGQLMLVRSDDDGVTWSDPINITEQVKRPEWCFVLQGPGKGITMHNGTIVFAAQYQDPVALKRLPHSTIIYSRDHGKTWHVGTGAFDDTTESQVVEIEPGVLMLNCRYNRSAVRAVMITRDMGRTWEKHSTSLRSLIEPRACMASLIDVRAEFPAAADDWLLFSNPDSTSQRHRLMIKGSPDRGRTWPAENRVLLDDGRGRGYSCLSMIDASTVGILYEGSRAHMTFQRISLGDIVTQPEHEPDDGGSAARSTRLQLPQVFGDHMVLQAEMAIPVWGTATPGTAVRVVLGTEVQETQANGEGRWKLEFAPRAASADPIVLTVEAGAQQLQLSDVLVGEVWICAGQSNMEWPLVQSQNGATELADADVSGLRLLHLEGGARGSSGSYTTAHLNRLTRQDYSRGRWQLASKKSAERFSAVAWYFGRRLRDELDVPVGLICPAVGGTPTEAWIPHSALHRHPDLRGLLDGNWLDNPRLGEFCRTRGEENLRRAMQAGESIPGDAVGPNHSFKPGFMWDAGIKPLIPYAMRGAIWYQGESNAETLERVRQHNELFPLLVREWRRAWQRDSFPFLFVQLPAIQREWWPWFREGQRRLRDDIENVGMAVTIDTGHRSNVHPATKKVVGQRLARQALALAYTQDDAESGAASGPLFESRSQRGQTLRLEFRHCGRGLRSQDDEPLRHFEVCGPDGQFHSATARISGPTTIDVTSRFVSQPQEVRYAWRPFPDPPVNLVNSASQPASPFSSEADEVVFSPSPSVAREPDDRPNILLIVGEDHGCELSCYGDPVIKTPHIDGLAAGGLLFENGYVTQSVCSPSRSTIFTGLYPHQNGQLGLATHQYGWFRKWPTTYSLLKQAGYRTGLIGKTHVIPEDAVESWVDFRFQPSSNFAKRKVSQYAVEAGRFFAAGDEPFFMTVNYPDAHWPLQGQVDGLPVSRVKPEDVELMPYVGDATPRMLKVARNYYDCMLRLDACVGQLLDELNRSGKANNTLVIFIGDHGAQMARGKVTVYEGGVRVPFIARWPGVIQAGQRSPALVSTIDLLPTFTDVARIEAPSGLPGQSLKPMLSGSRPLTRRYLACERNCDAARHTFPQRTIRDERFKLIHSPVRDREDPAARYYREHGASHWSGCLTDQELTTASDRTRAGYARWLNPPEFQLYDLRSDPHEWRDLAEDPRYGETKQRLLAALRQWQRDTADPIVDPALLQRLVDENDAVFKANRRSPQGGWKYLEYLDPSRSDEGAADPQSRCD